MTNRNHKPTCAAPNGLLDKGQPRTPVRDKELAEQFRRAILDLPENVRDQFVRADLGIVNGDPVIRAPVIEDDAINDMTEAEMRASIRLMNYSYKQVWAKLMQFSNYVPKEILKRDPGAACAIWIGFKEGKSDRELANELGESVRYVQSKRLAMGASMKKPRGRPRKPT